jgi:hypothetical protein
MKYIFWIALKLRLRQKFWADLFWKWHKRQIKKIISKIDLSTDDIRFY